MRPFEFIRAETDRAALASITAIPTDPGAGRGGTQYLAGGTTLIDLMKIDVMRPKRVIDINSLSGDPYKRILLDERGLRLGALIRMADAADHAGIKKAYPMLAQSLTFAASQQLRNMASLGGNVLQRTRCTYFRDVSYAGCNKRDPGSGCAALEGVNRAHAVLGTSNQCIATYPGDFAQTLIALDARINLIGPNGPRAIAFADLHRLPTDQPHMETNLADGELIAEFVVPATPSAKRSVYLKIRDRASYEFALASAAVALDLDRDTIRDARIALGGVATVPWRAADAERTLTGKAVSDEAFAAAAEAAFVQARPSPHNAFKVALGKRTLIRALHQASVMEI